MSKISDFGLSDIRSEDSEEFDLSPAAVRSALLPKNPRLSLSSSNLKAKQLSKTNIFEK
jgi:hypothetical protein